MKRGLAGFALLLLLAAGACSADTGHHPDIATARTAPPPTTRPATAVPPMDEATRRAAFVACMRGKGIEIADAPTTGWGNLVNDDHYLPEGKDTRILAAYDECEATLPPVPAPDPVSPAVLAQYRAYAQCMRDHGISDFPDPGPNGELTGAWLRDSDPAVVAACESHLPKEGL